MTNTERQMPGHVTAAYRDAVDNILFLKRQQWLATNYVLDLRGPRSYWYQPEVYISLMAVSFVGAVLTAIYLWSVR